ncbi:VOC family protein [Mucilaginibacter sp. cycad4]|uniref:VOC family protein n=1 Tax=Mucilaginibacter sp. cycad4 TaxID=3342096 RepID=UPI002AAAE58D|nr:VOC family protein [Mucilaginibacter gossypii]WPV02814.1 VOC family protein [Mucilaginibacter gossypii]
MRSLSIIFKTAKLTTLLLVITVLLPVVCEAQNGTDISPVVDHIAITTGNLKKSTEFYTKVLHLKKVDNPFADTVHQWYSLGNNVKLHVIQAERNEKQVKGVHLCFTVSSVKEFAKTLDEMNIPYSNWKGDSKEPTYRADGVLQLYFQDPDGYWIEINSPAKK